MGWLQRIRSFIGGGQKLPPPNVGMGVDDLSRRLGLEAADLLNCPVQYHSFKVAKRSGGLRTILAPAAPLKAVQRRIARRLLRRLTVHPAAMGFVTGESIATHAMLHVHQAVVVRMDIRDFFSSTSARRVHAMLRRVGWNDEAARLLVKLCTHGDSLPQGAPTSPALSNIVNYRLDMRLAGLAEKISGNCFDARQAERRDFPIICYSRYADDVTFSFSVDDRTKIQAVIRLCKQVVQDEGYRLHTRKKLRIMRRCDRQQVTGLVVNDTLNLPRALRRRLRAAEHHLRTGRSATFTAGQLQGFRALQHMIHTVRSGIG